MEMHHRDLVLAAFFLSEILFLLSLSFDFK